MCVCVYIYIYVMYVCVSSGSYIQAAVTFLNKINVLVFVMYEQSVYCEVETIAVHRHCFHSPGGAVLTMKAYGEMEV